jgi:type II secretory pathway pseudopilin PulG
MKPRRRVEGDRGETLLELIIAILILGTCVVAIGAGITTSVKMSAIHRDQATAGAFLHNYAEGLQSLYPACSSSIATDYTGSLAAPTGFTPPSATIKFWDPTAAKFVSGACPSPDPGLRQVSLTLASSDGFVSESLVFVVRKSP